MRSPKNHEEYLNRDLEDRDNDHACYSCAYLWMTWIIIIGTVVLLLVMIAKN